MTDAPFPLDVDDGWVDLWIERDYETACSFKAMAGALVAPRVSVASTEQPQRIVFVYNQGGWDVSMLFDPNAPILKWTLHPMERLIQWVGCSMWHRIVDPTSPVLCRSLQGKVPSSTGSVWGRSVIKSVNDCCLQAVG